MISILTYNPKFLSKEKIKFWIKKILNKPRGPEVVLNNLVIGLKRNNFDFQVNKITPETKTIHAISSVDALKWAIKQKEKGKINELIAGPNIVRHPPDDDSILVNKNIDKILVPSKWMAKYFSALEPKIKDKLYIWPAGTECDIKISSSKKERCILYKKNVGEKLFENIKKYLEENKISYNIIEYGKYKAEDYLKMLDETKFLIYLQTSESQGIALQEAWAHNVPTFVWNSIISSPLTGSTIYEKVAAPYLTDESGDLFKDFEDFKNKLPKFIENLKKFKPAEYCKNNLSIEKSAEIYVNIIENRQKPWKKL
jgi:hypothetical protein